MRQNMALRRQTRGQRRQFNVLQASLNTLTATDTGTGKGVRFMAPGGPTAPDARAVCSAWLATDAASPVPCERHRAERAKSPFVTANYTWLTLFQLTAHFLKSVSFESVRSHPASVC